MSTVYLPGDEPLPARCECPCGCEQRPMDHGTVRASPAQCGPCLYGCEL